MSNKDWNQRSSLTRVLVFRRRKLCSLGYPKCALNILVRLCSLIWKCRWAYWSRTDTYSGVEAHFERVASVESISVFYTSFQILFILSLIAGNEPKYEDYKYPTWSIAVGWLMVCSSLVCIPGYIVFKFIRTPGTPIEVSWLLIHYVNTSNRNVFFCATTFVI